MCRNSSKKHYLCGALTNSARCARETGLTGFDSRQSLEVSTPSSVWRLVNPDAQTTNGNNSYALAA